MLIERKAGCKLVEVEACPDHIHMLLEIPPKYSISEFMGYLKSKSTYSAMWHKNRKRCNPSQGYTVPT